ncbi:MAG: C40 family peptidase [Oscillospiraceae bacterium]|jgi:hypothetical protein|nr:C40 family peptidase [Oscillospiraceae bacterium]
MVVTSVSIASLHVKPDAMSELSDEVLFGMPVDILDETGDFYKIRTFYRYEGFSKKSNFIVPDEQWSAQQKSAAAAPFTDIMAEPDVTAGILAVVPRGGVVGLEQTSGDIEFGWQKVCLPNGLMGYARMRKLMPHYEFPVSSEETAFRETLVQTARTYLGSQYRWGGKTMQGIDCSGLVFMAYLLCGVIIWRDAAIKPEFPIREMDFSEVKPGDLIFFTGHVAMYIGDGEYIHSTGHPSSDGVVINSLNPASPLYREDLPKMIKYCGRYTGF